MKLYTTLVFNSSPLSTVFSEREKKKLYLMDFEFFYEQIVADALKSKYSDVVTSCKHIHK